jgi:hypothetical protein
VGDAEGEMGESERIEGTGLHTVPPAVPPPLWWEWVRRADGTWRLRYVGAPLCSETEWQTIEQLCRVPTPDSALRATIDEAVTIYVEWMWPPSKPYPVVPSAATVRTIRRQLESVLRAVAGLPALTPRMDETFAARVVVRHVVHAALPERDAEAFEDALRVLVAHADPVAEHAARLGAEVADPPGPASERDALVELRARLERLLAARCPGATMLRFRQDRKRGTVEYGGLLYDVVRVIQPALPAVPGSIALLGPAALYTALQRARQPDQKA